MSAARGITAQQTINLQLVNKRLGTLKKVKRRKKKRKKIEKNNVPPVKTNFIKWRLKLIKLPAKIIHKRVWHLVIKAVVSEQ